MDKLADLLIDTINSVFGEDKFSLIFYLGLILIAILLFKEFKNKIADDSKIKKEQLDIALKCLLELKFEFVKYQNPIKSEENYENLKVKIINAFPYVSYKLGEQLHTINATIENTRIDELIILLNLELEGLKRNQDSSIVMVNNDNIMDNISYILRTRFNNIFLSSTMTFIALTFILIIGFLSLALSSVESIWEKYYLIQMILNLVLFLFYVLLIGDLLQQKKIKNSLWSWGYVILTIIISIVLISLYKRGIWISSIHFALFFAMVLILKKFRNNSD